MARDRCRAHTFVVQGDHRIVRGHQGGLMAKESLRWDEIDDEELLLAVRQLLAEGKLTLPVCARCLRAVGARSPEDFVDGCSCWRSAW